MTYARTLAFAVHDPISIDGNVGFAGPNTSTGVTTGSGTEYDPYIIEGWETKSVSIANANAHFVIRNCYVHPGEGAFTTDIRINSCENGTVRDCICTA
jgi:hypothetical protein